MNCKDKIVLITGASSGIGKSCAIQLAKQGATLILTARRAEKLEQLAQELRKTYQVLVHIFPCDVTDQNAIEQALSQLPEDFKNIDVLINNAGLALGVDRMHEANLKDWEHMIDTNIKGVLYMTRAILPGMLARNSGHIVHMGSTSSHHTYAGGSVYCATKHAVHALHKTLSQEVAGTLVRVTEIDPGMVETEFSVTRFKGDAARAKKVYEHMTPLMPMDVADAVIYAITRPQHVNIAQIMLYSTDQPMAFRPT